MPVVATAAPTRTGVERAPAPKPEVTKLKPTSAPASGGTKVVVKGTNLGGATQVLFGKTKGTKLTVKSNKKLTVISPAGVGKVKLKVKTPAGKSKGMAFTYVPTVTKLSPANALASGGTTVTVTGAGFVPSASVTFGGVPGTSVLVTSPTSLTVNAPAHAVGAAPVVVKTGGQTAAPKSFTYLATPSMTVTPIPGVDQTLPSQTLDVACPAPGSCAAVGAYGLGGAQRAMVVTLASGTWTAADLTLPGDAHASVPTGELTDVSCPTATFCAAVGSYRIAGGPNYAAMATTWNGAIWSAAVPITLPGDLSSGNEPLILDLDCASASECRAVGYYFTASGSRPLLVSLVSSTWSATSPSMPVGASSAVLRRIECPAAGECMAVGFANESGGGSAAYVEAIVGGVPSAVVPTLPGDAISGASGVSDFSEVACTAVGACVAAGGYLTGTGSKMMIGRLAASVWTVTGSALPGDAAAGGAAFPYAGGLACPTTGQCAVAATYRTGPNVSDQQLLMGSVTGSSQLFAKRPLPADAFTAGPSVRPGEVICSTVGRCVHVGSHADTGPTSRAHIVRMSGGEWLPPETLPLPTLATIATLLDSDADSSTTAVAVGQATVSGTQYGLLVTGIPIGP